MRNFVDALWGRNWRVWARNLDEAGGVVTNFAGEQVEYRFPPKAGEETWLAQNGTAITGRWGLLKDQLAQLSEAGYSNRDIKDLREESVRIRQEARGCVSYVRSHNVDRGPYQAYYNRFAYVTDRQVEIWDALLEFCDSPDQAVLDRVSLLLDECEQLGEEALLMLPELVQRRREESRKHANRIRFWVCAVLLVAVGVVGGACYYFVQLSPPPV